ncbi:hypothetical protein COT62_02530 [Candidatus Roizmanbacteria bacterium CG09_land_8_20_14_0_10_41_9]|uniref:ribose-phosphate diphosphokinase n=1 Tax=Candidatus Roizmanbacteria bacterium CG09_land_8_20_14_0_10_41_9 TaxID=1974850 RepID=A0A2H0WSK9_9BACT|nr:MAG: hypothetical protein COT62_02530 [Candidatus Roizmanbacteria bacterium CG09_land_8_20_14_0_10_41_9]
MRLFSGTSHEGLAKEVSGMLHIPISGSEVVRFGNSEVRVRIDEEVKNELCLIVQSTSNPTDTHLMELFFFCDALRREEAKKVIGIIPYFGYARQDIQHRPGECISVNVIIRFLESIGFYKIYTIDLHDDGTAGVFSIPFKNLSALELLAKTARKEIKSAHAVSIVSPDQGGIERARKFGYYFFGTNDFHLSIIEKRRDLEKIHASKALDLYGDVRGKTVILVDDVVTSGKTLINAVDLCLERGADDIYAVIVHHDFTEKAHEVIQDSRLVKLFTTNTIQLAKHQKIPKLYEVSIAPLIVEEFEKK